MSATAGPPPEAAEPLPLEPEWLLEPLPKSETTPADLEVSDSRFESISALILRGDYVPAGRQSETILREGIYDVRVFGYYVFGVFIERGLPSLPLVFRAIMRMLGEENALFGPANKKQIQTENMLLWLISGILKNVELHSTLKDATWKQWLEAQNRPALDEAMQLCPQMQVALANFAPQSRAALRFHSLDGWLGGLSHSETGITKKPDDPNAESKNSKASPGSQRSANSSEKSRQSRDADDDDGRREAQAKPKDDDDDDDDDTDDEDHDLGNRDDPDLDEDEAHFAAARRGRDDEDDDEDDAPGRTASPKRPTFGAVGPSRPRAAAPSDGEASTAWQQLLERLQAFEALIAQGQYLKAAVVATDIQAAVASFDPVAYFPGLFAPYLTAFAEHMRPLEHYLNDTQAVKFKVLRQLYQVDFEKFMRKD